MEGDQDHQNKLCRSEGEGKNRERKGLGIGITMIFFNCYFMFKEKFT
jgi:hypothetical protein